MSLKVYYLDDESGLCDVFKDYMHSEEIQVETFTETLAAISFVLKSPPDIMFIDYRLADNTGDCVAKLLPNEIFKVLVTGELNPPSSDVFYEVVPKPYRLDELKRIIDKILVEEINKVN